MEKKFFIFPKKKKKMFSTGTSNGINSGIDLMELQNDLSLGTGTSQTTSECKWKTVYDNVSCPDPDINYYYYSGFVIF
mgnify:CR=1 FL=1